MDQPGKKGIHVKLPPFYDPFLKWAPVFVFSSFMFQAILSTHLSHWVHPESFEESKVQRIDKKVASTLRAIGFLSGYKVLVGHVFWIKVIQYYGDSVNSLTRYAKMYDYCSLASDLNPKFISVYTFGAAVLAFHVKRIDEALQLLRKGILANPTDQRLKLMYAAIAFQNAEQYEKVIPFLETQINRGDAPFMMVNILANTYEKVGRYKDAIHIWLKIQKESDQDDVKIQAAQKLQELYKMMRGRKP
jgi:tetratricopeptide (TPR) repeat protein